MQVVINIDEEKYKWLKEHIPKADKNSIVGAVVYGVPLPKGHGAIKDVSQIEIPMCEDRTYERWVQVAINSAPTIIEADEVES